MSVKNSPRPADINTVMTAACTQTLYAPNPPQLDDPWVRALIAVLVLFGLAALAAVGS